METVRTWYEWMDAIKMGKRRFHFHICFLWREDWELMNNRLSYIDGLKGLSAVCIFSFHYYTNFCNSDPQLLPFSAYGLFGKGWLAVELFFILSGFLMANRYSTQNMDITFRKYICSKLRRSLNWIVKFHFYILIQHEGICVFLQVYC